MEWGVERLEVPGGVVVAIPRRLDVLLDDRRLLGEGRLEHGCERLEPQTHQLHRRPDGHRVLHDGQLDRVRRKVGYRQPAQLHPGRRVVAGLELGAVVETDAARRQLLQVPIERVLVERDEHRDLVTVVEWLLGRKTQSQPGMPTTDDRLVAVVAVPGDTLSGHGQHQGVARGGCAVAGRASNTDDNFWFRHITLGVAWGLCQSARRPPTRRA